MLGPVNVELDSQPCAFAAQPLNFKQYVIKFRVTFTGNGSETVLCFEALLSGDNRLAEPPITFDTV
jgi:hypothetical protein